LSREYGSLEVVLENADKVKRAAYREGLKAHRESALLSKRLVTLRRDVPITLDLEALVCREPDRLACHTLFTELEFAALAREFLPEIVTSTLDHGLLLEESALQTALAEARAAGKVSLALLPT